MNRALLAVIGVILLAAGGVALGIHFGLLTFVDRDATLTPGAEPPPTWVLYVVAACGIVLALLALRWLVAQFTPPTRARTWELADQPDMGGTDLSTSAATTPFVADVATCPGVRTARARLSGPRDAPRLAVVVRVEQDASVPDVREHIGSYALPRLRQALDLAELPTTVEFRFTTRTGARVH